MSSLGLLSSFSPQIAVLGTNPDSRLATGNSTIGLQRLPTEPIGTTTITLTNIIDGSALQIESQDGSTTFHNSVVSGTSKVVTLQVYAPGSPLNNLRIKVRKGSAAPYYQPYETLLTAVVGSALIYVSQIPD